MNFISYFSFKLYTSLILKISSFVVSYFFFVFFSFLSYALFFSFFPFLLIFFVIGMSSGVAMGKHAGGLAEYRSSEGKAVTLPYRGMIKATINDILGGIRSSCTYVGAR